jgi:hypothetical protein
MSSLIRDVAVTNSATLAELFSCESKNEQKGSTPAVSPLFCPATPPDTPPLCPGLEENVRALQQLAGVIEQQIRNKQTVHVRKK